MCRGGRRSVEGKKGLAAFCAPDRTRTKRFRKPLVFESANRRARSRTK
jgi:hypothetical protein